jgi:alpha-glucosidase (family GH31 glycosyl hydrolase)
MYVRWVQFGAFQPILRLHSDHGYRLPWQYGPRAKRIASGFLRLRAALVPYTYTAAREAYDTGMPIARPMYLAWPGASQAYEFDSQYMFGDDLLVAPVTRPGASATKTIWFPPGRWVDIFTGDVHPGGRTATLRVPLDRMPVFARVGAVVPRQPEERGGGQPDPLALDVYAGTDGSSSLYEDGGEGFGYKRGSSARTSLRWSEADKALTIAGAHGHFPGMSAKRRYLVRFLGVERPGRVLISAGGRTRELHGWSYDPKTRRLEVSTGEVGVAAGATVRLERRRDRAGRHRGHHRPR